MNTTMGTQQPNGTFLPYYLHSTSVAASYIVSYFFIFVLCMVGNGLVCFVVLRNRRMRTVTNLFILNLAISDLLVGIFCVPTTLVDNLITGWPFSQFMCTMSGLIQGMSVSASVFTLVAIAVDRFLCIVYPFRQKMSILKAILAIALIWMLACAIMCPSAAMLTVIHLKDTYMIQDNKTYPLLTCFENWPQPEMRKLYTTVLFVHVYLAPLGLISLMYCRIAMKLFSNLGPVGRGSGEAQVERTSVSKKKVKVIKMLITVAVLFMVSWLPLWTLMLLTDYGDLNDEQIDLLGGYIFPFAHWLAFFNSGVNPIIYGYFNENFKRGFQAALPFRLCSFEVTHQQVYSQRTPRAGRFFLHNKVSNDESLEATVSKVSHQKGISQHSSQGNKGILLEDINQISTSKRVSTAWQE
ncbi:neuropeptide FF receptor 1 like 1 [Amia ocellicauda]|uniref:neuropeptide FF receptor 1 like 1 n=1 Tax=Amia ocellicauda TaxID=2972642 RepID=UPI003463A453